MWESGVRLGYIEKVHTPWNKMAHMDREPPDKNKAEVCTFIVLYITKE